MGRLPPVDGRGTLLLGALLIFPPVPYVPDWRATLGATYRPDAYWALTAAMRCSGKQYSTPDNTDIISNVYGAFDSFTVVGPARAVQILRNRDRGFRRR